MRIRNVFISHSWNYSEPYERFVKLLERRPYFEFKNYSVPKNDPIHNANSDAQLKAAIKNKMTPCGVILILAGVYSTYSKWINIEIDLAQNGFNSPKPIIAVEPWGSKHTSAIVKNAANRVVRWDTESVVKAIRELS